DVRPSRAQGAPRERQVAKLSARARVEDREVDVVASRAQLALELGDEDAEVGSIRARIHLRDDEDPHGRSVRAARAHTASYFVRNSVIGCTCCRSAAFAR